MRQSALSLSEETRTTATLLSVWPLRESAAEQELMRRVYADLHRLAVRHMRRERRSHTLQPTALLHETYLRLLRQRKGDWKNRAQFLAIASRTMRRLLLDHARRQASASRGGKTPHVALNGDGGPPGGRRAESERIGDALCGLAAIDPVKARVVELRFFAGLSIAETAREIGCSPSSVVRHWRIARAWLFRELEETDGGRKLV